MAILYINKLSSTGIIFNIKNNTIEYIKHIYSLYMASYMNIKHKNNVLGISAYNQNITEISKNISTCGRQFFYFKNHKATKIKNASLNNRYSPSLSDISNNNPGDIIRDIKKKLS